VFRRREADALHFTRSGSVQGRAPSSRPHVRKYVAAGEETPAPPPQRKPSRDRFRRWVRPAHGAGGWRWKASRIVWWASLHGASTTHGLGGFADLTPRASEAGTTGSRQGCQRCGLVSEAHGRKHRVPTRDRPPKRIRRCEPPGPPVSVVQGASPGEGARRKPRRDAGNGCDASARSRTAVGSRSRSKASGFALRVLSQGRPQEGEAARRKLLDPLARSAEAHLHNGWAARGGGAACRKARGSRRRGTGVTPGARAQRCAGVKLERNREGMTNGSVRRREASGVHG